MLSIEMRVNGELIGYADVINESEINGKTIYSVGYKKFGEKQIRLSFCVAHRPEEGAEKLALLVYQELNEKLKEIK